MGQTLCVMHKRPSKTGVKAVTAGDLPQPPKRHGLIDLFHQFGVIFAHPAVHIVEKRRLFVIADDRRFGLDADIIPIPPDQMQTIAVDRADGGVRKPYESLCQGASNIVDGAILAFERGDRLFDRVVVFLFFIEFSVQKSQDLLHQRKDPPSHLQSARLGIGDGDDLFGGGGAKSRKIDLFRLSLTKQVEPKQDVDITACQRVGFPRSGPRADGHVIVDVKLHRAPPCGAAPRGDRFARNRSIRNSPPKASW